MKKHFNKRRVVLAAILAVALGLGAGAYAYFTAAGAGTGSATVGSATGIAITSDTPADLLYPGGADVTVSVHVTNNGSGSQYVNQISGTVADNGSCLGSWFQVDSKTLGATIAHGATADTSTPMRMLDNGNQDACVGKTLTITWASS